MRLGLVVCATSAQGKSEALTAFDMTHFRLWVLYPAPTRQTAKCMSVKVAGLRMSMHAKGTDE